MDPEENIAEQRVISKMLLAHAYVSDADALVAAARLAELVEALDAWIVRGGAMPSAWVWTPFWAGA